MWYSAHSGSCWYKNIWSLDHESVWSVVPHFNAIISADCVMRVFFLFSVFTLSIYTRWTESREIQVLIDGTKPIHVVNNKSPSFAVGMGLFKYGWTKYLNNVKLLTLVKALGPSYLRMGGTKSDHSHFVPNIPPILWDEGPINCVGTVPDAMEFEQQIMRAHKADLQQIRQKLREEVLNVTYTGPEFDDFVTFVRCAKWNLIFGLNLLDRKDHKWDSTNTEELLQYAKVKRYLIDWELGNEPNTYFHKVGYRVTASDDAKAFFQFNNILRRDTWWKKSRLFGPDSSGMFRASAKAYFNKFLHYAGTVINAATFHQYYVNSRTATLQNFTNPKILNTLIPMVRHVVKIAEQQSPNVPVWLGETSSSFGGGAEGLSDTYAAGFMWLDKLGVCAENGVNMVFRQTLLQGNYALINDSFDPYPDYWLTLLYKRLVGPKVLNVTMTSLTGGSLHSGRHFIRVYAHCTNSLRTSYSDGSITLYYLNLSKRNKTMSIVPQEGQDLDVAMSYILTSSPAALNSSDVYLNGVRLVMIDDHTMPDLTPQTIDLKGGKKIRLPAMSFGFIVLPDLNTTACT